MADFALRERGYQILAGILLSAAAVGFFSGTRSGRATPRGYVGVGPAQPLTGTPAASYRELREQSSHPNARVYDASRLVLEGYLPSLTDPVPPRTEVSRAEALRARGERRAFDGAPPTIPHAIDARGAPSCMVCHERGVKIGEHVAPQLSHVYYASCTQCHAPGAAMGSRAVGELPFERPAQGALVESTFEPREFGGLGARAYAKAPPVVPHSEFMRERCSSCHGPSGALGLETPHPQRQSCRQCHVGQAAREQMTPGLASL